MGFQRMNIALSLLIKHHRVYVALTKGDVDYAIEYEGRLLRVLIVKVYKHNNNFVLRVSKTQDGEKVIPNFDIVAAYSEDEGIVWLIPFGDLPLCSSTTLSDKYDDYRVTVKEDTNVRKTVKEVKVNEIVKEKKSFIALDKEEQKRVEDLLNRG